MHLTVKCGVYQSWSYLLLQQARMLRSISVPIILISTISLGWVHGPYWFRLLIRPRLRLSCLCSRMHKIFEIDELVKEITRHMFAWHTPQYSILDWVLTCKTISEPALDVLWETQDSLINLLTTLPPDIWEVNRRKLVSDSQLQNFTRLTSASILLAFPHLMSGAASRSIDFVSITYK